MCSFGAWGLKLLACLYHQFSLQLRSRRVHPSLLLSSLETNVWRALRTTCCSTVSSQAMEELPRCLQKQHPLPVCKRALCMQVKTICTHIHNHASMYPYSYLYTHAVISYAFFHSLVNPFHSIASTLFIHSFHSFNHEFHSISFHFVLFHLVSIHPSIHPSAHSFIQFIHFISVQFISSIHPFPFISCIHWFMSCHSFMHFISLLSSSCNLFLSMAFQLLALYSI